METVLLNILLITFGSPLCIGSIRKLKAFMQNRQGASIWQPYADLWKLLHKDEVISKDSSWVFRFAPYMIFAVTITTAAFIQSDLLVIIYLIALSTFFLALAGLDTGSAFGGFGSSREMTLAALSEGGLLFSFLPLALLAQSTNLATISSGIAALPITSYAPVVIALLAFFIVLLAETGRFPFDNPATHLELTMIHEAMILEYSGKRLALVEWASYNKLMIFMVLGANIFLSGGSLTVYYWPVWLLKIAVFIAAIGILESSIAKLRFFRLPDLLLTSFILGIIALFMVIN